MEKEFVPFVLALRLKNLGFDEPCLGVYRDLPDPIDKELGIDDTKFEITTWFNQVENKSEFVLNAPTWQTAFEFFRNKYNLFHRIIKEKGYPEYWSQIEDLNDERRFSKLQLLISGNFQSYGEAEFACLEKLLQLVENA